MQSDLGRRLAAAHGLDADNPDSFVFFNRGRALARSAAVAAVAARLPAPWRWAGVLRLLPRAVRDGAYDWVAARRYRLFGKRERCMVPTPDQRARFLE